MAISDCMFTAAPASAKPPLNYIASASSSRIGLLGATSPAVPALSAGATGATQLEPGAVFPEATLPRQSRTSSISSEHSS
jgi:hypothetical protein